MCFCSKTSLYFVICLESAFLGLLVRSTFVHGLVLSALISIRSSQIQAYAIVFTLSALLTLTHGAAIACLIRALAIRRNLLISPYCVWRGLLLIATVGLGAFLVSQGFEGLRWLHYLTGSPDGHLLFALALLHRVADPRGLEGFQYPKSIGNWTETLSEATFSRYNLSPELKAQWPAFQTELVFPLLVLSGFLGLWCLAVALRVDLEGKAEPSWAVHNRAYEADFPDSDSCHFPALSTTRLAPELLAAT